MNQIKIIIQVGLQLLSFAALIGGSFWFRIKGQTVEMGLMIAAGGLGFGLANFDKLSFFKAAGLEMKLKETIHEAEVKMEDLKQIGLVLSELSLNTLARVGLWGTAPLPIEKQQLMESLCAQLRKIKANEDEINKVIQTFTDLMLVIHLSKLEVKIAEIRQTVDAECDEYNSIEGIRAELSRVTGPNQKARNPDEVERIVHGYDFQDPELEEYLEDYRHYFEHSKFRRRDNSLVWYNKKSW